MPIIEMHMMKGRTDEQKRCAARAVTDAIAESLGVKKEAVRILITEHGDCDFFVSGLTMAERNHQRELKTGGNV